MNSIIKGLFRSLEATIHERLAVIEEILVKEGEDTRESDLEGKLSVLSDAFESLSTRLSLIESSKAATAETVHVNRIGKDTTPSSTPLFINAMRDLEIIIKDEPSKPVVEKAVESKPVAKKVVNEVVEIEEIEEEEEVEEEEVEEEVEEEEVEEEVEEELEEEVEEEVEEEEEEEEAVEEFTFKNKTYYRDGSKQVYVMGPDGELKEDPVGRWDEARKIVLFKRA